jgi:formate hydrogenlyase subunit 6/NADH:ubiquinone oxidoreductase subunit I
MRLATMFKDALRSLFARPVTRQYPRERTAAPERLRGKLEWHPENCTGCQLCTKDCPADAIQLVVLDKDSRHFELRYDMNRCIYCGQCVESCRFNCIELRQDQWELAGTAREARVVFEKAPLKKDEPQQE